MSSDNTAKHTPGPWNDNSYLSNKKLELACAVWNLDSDKFICTTRHPGKSGCGKDEQHANARLIAAAPALLAACEAMHTILANISFADIPPGCSGGVTYDEIPWTDFEAAIAKAKGTTPPQYGEEGQE